MKQKLEFEEKIAIEGMIVFFQKLADRFDPERTFSNRQANRLDAISKSLKTFIEENKYQKRGT